jgi:hypothetical protein
MSTVTKPNREKRRPYLTVKEMCEIYGLDYARIKNKQRVSVNEKISDETEVGIKELK